MRRIFRFTNDLSVADIVITEQGVKTVYIPLDDSFPVRKIDYASVEAALKDIFMMGYQTHRFQCDKYTQDSPGA